jgi:hypothetical protein
MNDSMEPALSAKEWAELRRVDERGTVRVDGDAVEAEGRFAGDERRALAALALHGEAFGFNWKDVDMIRSAVLADDMHSHEDWWALQRLADRIAALLPPRRHRPHSGLE